MILPALALTASGCRSNGFPDVPAGYREYAYVGNAASNTVSVLDLVYLRPDRTLEVGVGPAYLAVNSVRNEVYSVNTLSGTVSVIDAAGNRVVATIFVHRLPRFMAVDALGKRAYVVNSGSNTVSVLDLQRRREIGTVGTGEQPGQVRLAPDGRTLVVSNRASGSVSVFDVAPDGNTGSQVLLPKLRAAFPGCPGAADIAVLPDASKAFVACSAGHQVMAVSLAADPGSWAARHNSSLTTDHLLSLLDVGEQPMSLAMKPDGGEIFVSNYGSDSISEIATSTNEVGGTYTIGSRPMRGLVSRDNGTLWVSNSGADSIGIYSIDDGKLEGSVHTGSGPGALALSADEHLLLAADLHSGDVSVIRTQGKDGPALFTILPAGGSPASILTKVVSGK